MRKKRDSETTKRQVLEAAKKIFAEHGFAGTSLASIAEESGISDGLILHHFKSKENLYETILNELSKEYYKAIINVDNTSGNLAQTAFEMLQNTFTYWCKDSVYSRIATWAFLENRVSLIKGEKELTTGLAENIRQMQAKGLVDERFSPFVLLAMTIGPIQFWMRSRNLFKEALKLDGSDQELDQRFFEQYSQMVMKLYQSPSMIKREEEK